MKIKLKKTFKTLISQKIFYRDFEKQVRSQNGLNERCKMSD